MCRVRCVGVGGAMLMAASLSAQSIPSLPDSTGFGVHVLALARAPDSAIWVGTYGDGIYVLRKNAAGWEHITRSRDTAAHAISFDFVHAFAFGPKGEVWYGTVGNGWGVSTDGGKTWRNWEFNQLGPEWQYVAPNGVVTLGDTTYIATADGIKVTGDDGQTWAVITDSIGATTTTEPVLGKIQNQYVLAIAAFPGSGQFPGPNLWISTLRGLGHSPDGGRSWHEHFAPPPCAGQGCVNRARALLVDSKNRFWVGTERGVYRFGPEFGGWGPALTALPVQALFTAEDSLHVVAGASGCGARTAAVPLAGDSVLTGWADGLTVRPGTPSSPVGPMD